VTRFRFAALSIALSLCICLAGVLDSASALAFKRTAAGEVVKDFALETLGGEKLRLSESLGTKATLVIFWAAWSPRSADLLADVQRLYAKHAADGLKVVAVNCEHPEWNPAEAPKIAAAAKQAEASYPVLLDKNLEVFNDYGVVALPSTVLANAEGRIVELFEGYPTALRRDLPEMVLKTLGVQETGPARVAAEPKGYQPKGKADRYLQMGIALMKKHRPSHAVEPLKKALEEDPDYVDAQKALVEALKAAGKDEEAEALAKKFGVPEGQKPASNGASAAAQTTAGANPRPAAPAPGSGTAK